MGPTEALEPGLPEGLTVHDAFFSEQECSRVEAAVAGLPSLAASGGLREHTLDAAPRRSKYFFGFGYTYGAQAGGRGAERLLPPELVDPIPPWIQELLVSKLERRGVVPRGWVNSAVVNDYRPGGMIVGHVDPPQLFARPIAICSFHAAGRLVFGASFSVRSDAATSPRPPRYIAALPRGSLALMDGFAADGITHGIRPADLDGRRVSIVLRHVLPSAPRVEAALSLPPAQRGARQEALRRWLLEVDGGEGFLLDHLRPLAARFASPEEAQEACVAAGPGLESPFFSLLGVRKLGRRRLFLRWLAARGAGPGPSARRGICPADLDGQRVSVVSRHLLPSAAHVEAALPPAQHGAKQEALRRWLLEVDGGKGFLLDHLRPLAGRFDSPEQAEQAYAAAGLGLESPFFSAFGVQKLGHRRLFLKWFAARGVGSEPSPQTGPGV